MSLESPVCPSCFSESLMNELTSKIDVAAQTGRGNNARRGAAEDEHKKVRLVRAEGDLTLWLGIFLILDAK